MKKGERKMRLKNTHKKKLKTLYNYIIQDRKRQRKGTRTKISIFLSSRKNSSL